jgi:phytanoyl-CoA hydroxylase
MAKFNSRFGGMWLDSTTFFSDLLHKVEKHEITEQNVAKILEFSINGYVIFNELVSHDLCDEFACFIDDSISNGNDELIIQSPGETEGNRRLSKPEIIKNQRIVDSYMVNDLAKKILLIEEVSQFLGSCFEEAPLLFQSLSFIKGSNQGMHQDTAYVVTNQPMKLIASWIALEDINPGSGELEFYPQSHRYEEFLFSGKHKHFSSDRDGDQEHQRFTSHLRQQIQNSGKTSQTFLAKKGDVFLWHADLYHGGSSVTDNKLTRNSLVGHYCPASVRPNFFNYSNDRVYNYNDSKAFYCSCYY